VDSKEAAVAGNGVTDAIVVEGLTKRFGDVQAVADVSFRVRRGEVFGFLGPNGAGKTTTINLLTGLARGDAGTIRIGGIDCVSDPRGAQQLIGVVPDESNLYPELTGLENLEFCAALFGSRKGERRARARELLETFGLTEAADRLFDTYSKGMKRKLTIAAGIIHDPEILFLDEPTTGLDVSSARQLRQLVADLHEAGTTVFLTTHNIEEAERLCDRIAFIVSGRIVRSDTVEGLIQPVRSKHVVQIRFAHAVAGLEQKLAGAFPGLDVADAGPGLIQVQAEGPVHVGPLVRFLEGEGADVEEARRVRPTLEDVFVETTGVAAETMGREHVRPGGGP
jgi:ABC-2 type transport system ATP-binding protein